MKKKFRIKRDEEFVSILRNKQYFATGSFVIYTKAKSEAQARVGISVPKKLGNAVLRNTTKRQVRDMIRDHRVFQGNKDIIVMVRNGYFSKTFTENKNDLEKLLKKVKIENDVNVRSHG